MNSSFVEDLRARLAARSRDNSIRLADDLAAGDADTMLDYSMISGPQLTDPVWSTTSQMQQSEWSQIDLFSPNYPTLFSLQEDTRSLGGGEVSIAESLRSPGQFGGAAADSAQQQTQRRSGELQQLQHVDPMRSYIEFPAILPPTSFPVVSSLTRMTASYAPIRRAPSIFLPDADERRGQLLPRPQCLLPLQTAHDGGYGDQMPDTSRDFLARPTYLEQHYIPPFVRGALWQGEQNEPVARRTARATTDHSRRNSCSNSSAGSSRGSSAGAVDCSYCRSVNKDPTGHNKYNCPILMLLPPCRNCGASGRDNHTESHCPSQAKTVLQFIPGHSRQRSYTI